MSYADALTVLSIALVVIPCLPPLALIIVAYIQLRNL